ncbi:MAG: SUMF1/EgtB/PvdO family nonheme iron enzyme [Phycisphaerae bacterium]|jgi:formylglycine-generating enzyme required for sulfatase activity
MFFNSRYLKILLLLASMTETALCSDLFNSNPHYLLASDGVSREIWLQQANEFRQKVLIDTGEIPSNKDLIWMSNNFTCRMCMMFDSEFIKPGTNEYLIDSLLAEGQKEFGGYDSIVLWQAYPRLGIDERNQFDMYRQMPGGLKGLRRIVEKCHAKNVKVFIDYNPWDTGTHREDKDDYKCLAEIAAAINADGVFLDTLSATDKNLRKELDNVRQGLALVPEGCPEFAQLALCSGSWVQWLDEPNEPGILKLKWVEPSHIQYQIRRWDIDRSDEIRTALFNGSGMLIWENIFGTYNPWNITDRQNWKKANLILHYFKDKFTQIFEPYYPAMQNNLFVTHWSGKGKDVFVLVNKGDAVKDKPLLEIAYQPNMLYYDIWNGKKIEPQIRGNIAQIFSSIDKIGCIAVINKSSADGKLQKLLKEMKTGETKIDSRNFSKDITYADKINRTKAVSKNAKPEGMVFVPATEFTMEIEHIRRECGCYPDPGEKIVEGFGYGLQYGAVYPYVIHQPIKHKIGPLKVKSFFIDETEVTNAQYKKFLDSTGYKPKYTENFLNQWPSGQMPENMADYPVVNVNIDDARAYANWAGKRLPTEEEWQLAAQGTDNRKWPWGNEFDPNKCNTTGQIMPAKSYPQGRSAFGCYNMSGNVWECTESCRDDGHTRFVMIRGGSYFDAQGSIWYVKGGPQPCGHHTKFIHIWPGLDRCSTVGFRCVVNTE